MKGGNNWKRVSRVVLSLLLAAAMAIESAGSCIMVRAAGLTGEPVIGEDEDISEKDKGEEGTDDPEEDKSEEGTEDPEEDKSKDDIEDLEEDKSEEGTEDSEEDKSEEGTEDSEEDKSEEGTEDSEGDESEEGTEDSEEYENEEEVEDSEDYKSEEDTEEEDTEDEILPYKYDSVLAEAKMKAAREELDAWAAKTRRIPNGNIDVDYQVERLSEPVGSADNSFPAARDSVFLPVKYDARDAGLVSSVKNQGGWGTCWAFSAVATAESSYKRLHGLEQEPNLSESHLVNFFYNGNAGIDLNGPDGGLSGDRTTAIDELPVNRGGNTLFTTFAMANWTGRWPGRRCPAGCACDGQLDRDRGREYQWGCAQVSVGVRYVGERCIIYRSGAGI